MSHSSSRTSYFLANLAPSVKSGGKVITSNPDYKVWNYAIASHFFNSNNRERPVYLQADTESLIEIGQSLGLPEDEAVEHFIERVRKVLRYDEIGFENIERFARMPLKPEEPPLFIGFLAFCVLAASRMERDEEAGIAATNYYTRLNDLLRLKRLGKPRDFEKSLHAWQRLKLWLNEVCQGSRGIATAQPFSEDRPYVGYPQSQCLVRSADRQQLPLFFHWARLQPEDRPDQAFLLKLLQSWTHQSSASFSRRLQRFLQEGGNEGQAVASIVAFELQNWDGSIPMTGGNVKGGDAERSYLHLRFNALSQTALWQEYRLAGDSDALSYDPISLPNGPAWLTGNTSTTLEPIMVFGRHPELGEWIHRPRIALSMPSVLIVHVSVESAVDQYLQQKAAKGVAKFNLRNLPPSWRCFRNVRIEHADTNAPWMALQTYPEVALRLLGGLKIDRQTYLTGHEPVLEIAAEHPIGEVLLNSTVLPTPTQNIIQLDLSTHKLSPGWHQISVDGRNIAFFTRNPQRSIRATDGMTLLGYVLEQQANQWQIIDTLPKPLAPSQVTSNSIILSGAMLFGDTSTLPCSLPHSIMIPTGFKRYVILGAQPGEITVIEGSKSIVGNQQSRSLHKFTVSFEPQWLVKVGTAGRYLSALQPSTVHPEPNKTGDIGATQEWANWVSRKHKLRLTAEAAAIWNEYQSVARALQGRR